LKYHQITSEERYTISTLRKQGYNPKVIALYLGRDKSTIYREIKRNIRKNGSYNSTYADSRARTRRSKSRRNQHFGAAEFELVTQRLERKWSPEQISGDLKLSGLLDISHETIYRYIKNDRRDGGTLYKYLRGAGKKRRKRYGAKDSRGRLKGKRNIADRPAEVEDRKELGHWEIDTVHGKGSNDCIVTLVERKSGFVEIGKLKNKSVSELNRRTIKLINRHPGDILTITADNGTEFHGYKKIEASTDLEFYFANPYHSWERGTNENTNGLIRQFLPKGTSMEKLTQRQCTQIANKLNSRPRKRLGYKTPKEVLNVF
jgi:IS30 family transposase